MWMPDVIDDLLLYHVKQWNKYEQYAVLNDHFQESIKWLIIYSV